MRWRAARERASCPYPVSGEPSRTVRRGSSRMRSKAAAKAAYSFGWSRSSEAAA